MLTAAHFLAKTKTLYFKNFNSSNILFVSDKASELRSWPRVIYLVGKSGWMQISIVMKLSLSRHSQPSCRTLFRTYMSLPSQHLAAGTVQAILKVMLRELSASTSKRLRN